MRVKVTAALAVTIALLPLAHADDLTEALRFAQPIMGDKIAHNFEAFLDSDPDEALSLILEGEDDDYFRRPGETRRPKPAPPFQTLGKTRLNYSQLAPIITEAARVTGLPPALIDAVIRTESGYRPGAVSRVGAMGLMQLMPATAREVGVTDGFDPRQNVIGGSRYLRKMYDRFGSMKLAIAAYNAGPGAVKKYKGVPPYRETKRYVRAVLSRFKTSRLR